ncbi:hypothetical protein FQN60_006586 [Etheostoma spectabile]|uniref:FERM domain-containing protein n=1 Tax=Etheostoma spectabile TaxID=54343 RepID=A0A5J5CER8_9PERO|nr:hypothetical protein FQN60_006586 [Etheostoma spectabile]
MVEPADRPSTAGQRLGAPESFGVSTLEPGLRPPVQPPGRQVSIRVQMLDDTQEVFQISRFAFSFAIKVGVCTWSHVEAFRRAEFKDRVTDRAAS